jgi:type II secretory pathway pseudopilin PulG
MKSLPLGFSKQEFTFVTALLLVLCGAILINLQVSYRKSRDLRRKDDVRAVTDALVAFQTEYSYFPMSTEDGRIVACLEDEENPPLDAEGNIIFSACEWGNDSIPNFLQNIPTDPQADEGGQYRYVSNGRRYQMYASLESPSEPEYNLEVASRGLYCGTKICNYGRAYATTPLDISLEEYENEIREK